MTSPTRIADTDLKVLHGQTNLGKQVEQELVEQAIHGDLHAFESLMRAYERRLYSLLYRWLQDRSAAEDVLQETTLRTYRALGKFRSGQPFKPWLFRIAINEAKTHVRKQAKHRRQTQELDVDPMAKAVSQTGKMRVIATLELGLTSISMDDRQLLLLRFAEELSLAEISQMLEVPEFVLKMRLHRARQRFRQALDQPAEVVA